jgi:hypothetical protein
MATLDQLLDQETFSAPDGFREAAVVSDPGIYERADRDPDVLPQLEAKTKERQSEEQ